MDHRHTARFVVFIALLCAALEFSPAQAAGTNRVPNPGFDGTGGALIDNATGTVPDYWRAFAVGGAGATVAIVPLAANALYAGSPATNAVQLTINTFGADQAFDHEGTPFSLKSGHAYTGRVYMRSANSGGASQQVTVAFPVFDVNGFTGRAPGSFMATVTSEWAEYSGPSFMESDGTAADLAFRLTNDGGDNSILIALPEVLGPEGEVPELTYPPIYTPGRNFADTDRFVSTMVFHWYNVFGGQKDGPWAPLEGRGNWSGEAHWWRGQIKDMMDANFDVLYVHLFNGFHYQREQFFKALHELRSEGYDTPYIVPFLDPQIIWNNNPIDMTQVAAKDEYVAWYTLFYNQYFKQDTGEYAESRLLHINEKVVLNTWVGTNTNLNYDALTRQNVESRLANALGDQYPSFKNGIYQISSTGGTMPSFSDEVAIQFSNTEYFSVWSELGKRNATMKGGYWDQNIRKPGIFFPRDGGAPYANAWNDLMAVRAGGNGQPPIYHTYVESWNEYDEGSGIYSASTAPPYIAPENTSGNNDTWSSSNNPREYIDSTYAGASEFNDTPDLQSRFLWHDFPASLAPGESAQVQILVRNEGDLKWSNAAGFKLAQLDSDNHTWGPSRQSIDDTANEVTKYGGVFRGRPVLFQFTITAPVTPGTYDVHYSMLRNSGGELLFGEQLSLQILVNDPNSFVINPGLNDAWVSADAPFQGFFFTVFDQLGLLFMSWFTFDSSPPGSGSAVFGALEQRWVTGAGFYSGNSVTLNVELTSGGIFNGSDPMASQTLGYGTITIVFNNCNEAILTYNFPSVGLSGQMTLTRVVPSNVPLCETLAEG